MDTRRRLAVLLAGLWAGLIAGIGFIAAPAAFALLQRPVAGALAGRMFAHEAYIGLLIAVLLAWLAKGLAQAQAAAGVGSRFSVELGLALLALFCTVFGYFGVQPLMAAAREGQGVLSFGALHGVSVLFFGFKGVIALILAWRWATPKR